MKKIQRPRFRTMRRQIALMFIAVMLLSVVSITAMNGLFLEKYYISKKVDVLLDAKRILDTLDLDTVSQIDEDYIIDEEFQDSDQSDLQRKSTRNNLTWVIINAENTKYYGWGENEGFLRSRLFGYIYDLDLDRVNGTILEESDDCVIQQVTDSFAGMNYVECWGTLEDGNYFLIRTPLESIEESASISNTFYFFVALIVLCISTVIITIYTRRITRPISELTRLSREMSSLNFDVHYDSKAGNEIDVLGESFNRMSKQLEQTISELKSANLKLQEDIEDKIKIDEMRKEFLDNVSHELKTPIALIQGYAEGLQENISEDPESREFYVEVIMDEASKMNKLVKNLLTLNQLESGKDAVIMERFDLVDVIRGVIQSMDIMIQQSEAQVMFRQEEPVYVWGDEFKIEEVLTNYTSNAIHHLSGERKIEIKIRNEGEHVRVSVFNTGNPIPEKDLPNLWVKFYKVDKARTREYGGSGIGLSIVKAIMEGMNQQYGVQNYDNGVEFWFTLDTKV